MSKRNNNEKTMHLFYNNCVLPFNNKKLMVLYILELYGHGLGYFGILLAISWPRIFLDTFGNIMA
jgi:hypothetical protein